MQLTTGRKGEVYQAVDVPHVGYEPGALHLVLHLNGVQVLMTPREAATLATQLVSVALSATEDRR